jgi:hypothetical protein
MLCQPSRRLERTAQRNIELMWLTQCVRQFVVRCQQPDGS